MSVAELLIRDGTVYFGVLCCLNIAALILDTTPQVAFNPTSSFIDSFTAILLCRLILNLRSYQVVDDPNATAKVNQMTSVRFANSLFDNIGASISLGSPAGEDESFVSEHKRVNATIEEVVRDPLGVGLGHDLCVLYHNVERSTDESHSRGLDPTP